MESAIKHTRSLAFNVFTFVLQFRMDSKREPMKYNSDYEVRKRGPIFFSYFSSSDLFEHSRLQKRMSEKRSQIYVTNTYN